MKEEESESLQKKRINLPHFAFSRGCILIADIYTPLARHHKKKLYTQWTHMTVVEILEGKCGYFSMDVIKTSFLNCILVTSII